MKKNFFISGYYCQDNLGDDFILHALLEGLKEQASKFVVLAGPRMPKAEFDKIHFVQKAGVARVGAIVKELLQCDVFILGGGGLFTSDSLLRSLKKFIMLYLAYFFGKKVVIIGVGISPVRNKMTRRFWASIMKKMSFVSVRDIGSFNTLEGICEEWSLDKKKLHSLSDLAFSLPRRREDLGSVMKKIGFDGNKRYCLFCIAMPWGEKELSNSHYKRRYERFIQDFGLIISKVRKKGMVPVFLPFYLPNDQRPIDDLVAKYDMDDCIVIGGQFDLNLREKRALFELVDISITMRFHSIVFSIFSGTPFVAISYDHKSERLVQKLGLLRYSNRFGVRSSEFFGVEIDLNVEEILTQIDQIVEEMQEVSEKLRLGRLSLIGESKQNILLMHKFIK